MTSLLALLSSVQLLPFLELKSHSIRTNGLSYAEAIYMVFCMERFHSILLYLISLDISRRKSIVKTSPGSTLYWGEK